MLNGETIKELTADLVASYVSNNAVPIGQLPGLIESVHAALTNLAHGAPAGLPAVELKPAVNPKKSVFPDYIVCLEDGRQFASLKRHLQMLGMTPAEYRTKWNLPKDYPIVAPGYSAKRSALAKKFRLGRKPAEPEPKKRGRTKKAV